MISKSIALAAKQKLVKLLNNPNTSIGLKLDHRGYIVKVYTKEQIIIPSAILNVPIEKEIIGENVLHGISTT